MPGFMRLGRTAILTVLIGGTLLAFGCRDDATVTPPAHAAADAAVSVHRIPASTGRTFYVSKSGSNSNPGTRARPWRTIQYAVGHLGDNQRALVRSGTYTENVDFNRSGTASNPKTLAAYPGAHVVIQSGSYPLEIDAAYWRIRGFILQGAGHESTNVYFESSAHHVELVKNNIRRSRDQGIFSEASTNDLDIIRNRIHDNGDGTRDNGHSNGIYLEGEDHYVANNVIYDHPHGFGIQIYPENSHSVIVNNTVTGSAESGIVVGGDGGVADIEIRNNILAHNRNYGVSMDSDCPSDVTIARNLFNRNRSGWVEGGCGVSTSGNLGGSPRFVSYPNRMLALRRGSPAIDEAQAAWAPGRDIVGRRRPQGPGDDIGAYERRK